MKWLEGKLSIGGGVLQDGLLGQASGLEIGPFLLMLQKCERLLVEIYTRQGTNISRFKGTFENKIPFPKVGYVSSQKGTTSGWDIDRIKSWAESLPTRIINFIIVTETKGNGSPTKIIVQISIGFPISPPFFVSSISP